MDFGCSAEGTPSQIVAECPALQHNSQNSAQQNWKPRKDRKITEICSYFFTFFTFMLAVLPQERSGSSPGMSGMSAPLACREGDRKSKKLKHDCKLWTLPAEQEPRCSAWGYKPHMCISWILPFTQGKLTLGMGIGEVTISSCPKPC